jgi:hypothetical protein
MTWFGIIGGAGRTIGPVVGGFLSSPSIHYPKLCPVNDCIFDTYPYALPNLFVSLYCIGNIYL